MNHLVPILIQKQQLDSYVRSLFVLLEAGKDSEQPDWQAITVAQQDLLLYLDAALGSLKPVCNRKNPLAALE
jgi:hypothetical protein